MTIEFLIYSLVFIYVLWSNFSDVFSHIGDMPYFGEMSNSDYYIFVNINEDLGGASTSNWVDYCWSKLLYFRG